MLGFRRFGDALVRMRITGVNNLHRPNVVDAECAIYRTSEIVVEDVVKISSGERLSAVGHYVPGKTITCPYDPCINEEYSSGMHFYLSKSVAIGETPSENGKFTTYHGNGARAFQGYKRNGHLFGTYKSFYRNNKLATRGVMDEGIRVGPWQGWLVAPGEQMLPWFAGKYRGNLRHGLWLEWKRGDDTPTETLYYYGKKLK